MTLIYYPYSQSYRRLSDFVPGRHREQGPDRNLAPAVPSTLELTWLRNKKHGMDLGHSPLRYFLQDFLTSFLMLQAPYLVLDFCAAQKASPRSCALYLFLDFDRWREKDLCASVFTTKIGEVGGFLGTIDNEGIINGAYILSLLTVPSPTLRTRSKSSS